MYADGARISSHSWGCAGAADECNLYTSDASDTDQFVFDHPDFMVVFAAGNDGAAGSVGSPGTAKNILCVGATQSSLDSWREYGGASYGSPDYGQASNPNPNSNHLTRTLNSVPLFHNPIPEPRPSYNPML